MIVIIFLTSQVYFYDGSFKCFTRDDLEYLCFAVFALVIGIFVILFPAFILLISFKRFKVIAR